MNKLQRTRSFKWRTSTVPFCGVLIILLVGGASAASAENGAASSAWRLALDGGAVRQFESSIDNGGEFDVDRYFIRFSATRDFGTDWNSGLSLGFGESRYSFSGYSGFGLSDPWGTIRQFRISIPIRYRSGNNWTYIGIPSLRFFGESGASASDSRQWGVLAAAAYRFSDRLTIGPGFGVFTDIEDSTDFFPLVFVDWKITDTFSLSTGRGLAATRGPGIALNWSPASSWRFSLEARYEKTRFRLDDDGPIPSGVGQDRSVPVALAATYRPSPDVELTLLGGVEFAGELRLEDSDGDRLDESDYDSAPFAGVLARVKF